MEHCGIHSSIFFRVNPQLQVSLCYLLAFDIWVVRLFQPWWKKPCSAHVSKLGRTRSHALLGRWTPSLLESHLSLVSQRFADVGMNSMPKCLKYFFVSSPVLWCVEVSFGLFTRGIFGIQSSQNVPVPEAQFLFLTTSSPKMPSTADQLPFVIFMVWPNSLQNWDNRKHVIVKAASNSASLERVTPTWVRVNIEDAYRA